MRRILAGVAMAAVAALAAAPAQAQDKAPPQFMQNWQSGIDEYNLGNWEKAREHFEKARKLAPEAPGPYRYLGRIARELKRWRECVERSTMAIKLNPDSEHAPKVRDDIEVCRSALGRPAMIGEIPDGQGGVAVITNVEGASVEVDGIKKGATPLSPFPVLAGKRKVKITRKGYLPVDTEVEVVPTITVDVVVELEADPNAPLEERLETPKVEDVKVGWLLVTTNVGGRASITLDDEPATIGSDGTIEKAPGIYVMEVRAPEYVPWRRRVVVVKGQKRGVLVELERADVRESQRTLSYISFGVAAAAGVAGMVFGFMENDKYDEAVRLTEIERARPAPSPMAPTCSGLPECEMTSRAEIEKLEDDGKRLGLISNISYGVAAVALGVSIYYMIQSRSEERAGLPLPLALEPTITPEGTRGAQIVFTGELDF